MPNISQKWLYNLSGAAPLCLVFAFTWWLQHRSTPDVWWISIVLLALAIVLVCAFRASFTYCRKNIPPIAIRINEFAPHDAWIVAYMVSYVIPFTSIVFDEFDPILSGMVAVVIIVIAPFVNSAAPNPLLFMQGYHFFLAKTETGASDFVLITKRALRNKTEIKYVRRIFEFLLLDEV